MDTDGPLSATILAFSIAFFASASLLETSLASIRREKIQQFLSQGLSGSDHLERLYNLRIAPTFSFMVIRVLSISTALISLLTLLADLTITNWAVIIFSELGLLTALGMLYMYIEIFTSTRGEMIARKISKPAYLFCLIVDSTLSHTRLLFRLKTDTANDNGDTNTPELVATEIDLPVAAVAEPLDEREVQMIHGVVRLDTTAAREIMIPRLDIIASEIGTSITELSEQMVRGGHSRIPIYSGDMDHIEGIAYARDILQALVHNPKSSDVLVDSLIRPALFIPESKTLEELLNEFQNKRVHVAIVVDEYGGVAGLVTIEDLLEEIVGEIQDEFELWEPEVRRTGLNELIMDASVGLDRLNELLNIDLRGNGFDTIGGFVYHSMGKIPSPGETVNHNGLRIEVISTIGRRLKTLKIKLLSS